MGKEAILDKIQDDAEIRANAMIEEANAKAAEIKQTVDEQCKAYYSKSRTDIDALIADVKKRGEAVAKLDSQKLLLKAKTEIVDTTFDLALEKLQKLPKTSLKKVLLGMLEYAEDGDIVTITENEKTIITKEVVADFAKKKGIKLTLNKEFGNFIGGMILSGKGIDKNLTFEVELQLLKDEIEADIAKELLADVR